MSWPIRDVLVLLSDVPVRLPLPPNHVPLLVIATTDESLLSCWPQPAPDTHLTWYFAPCKGVDLGANVRAEPSGEIKPFGGLRSGHDDRPEVRGGGQSVCKWYGRAA